MSAQLISVDPQKRDDPYYRYKMPEILTKIESSGNGVKTVFPNIRDVCDRLDRPEEIMIKYFGYVLGTQSTIIKKDDKFLVQGSHTQERLQEIVDGFIHKFVLCSHCRNPETDPAVEKKDIVMTCRSCGKQTKMSNAERAHGLFFAYYTAAKKNPKPAAKTSAAAATGGDNTPTKPASPTQPAPAATTSMKSDITSAPVAKPTQQANPIDLLATVLEQTQDIAIQTRNVIDLRTNYNLDDGFVVRLVFRAIVLAPAKLEKKPFIGALQKHVKLIARFTDKPELINILFKEIEYHCNRFGAVEKFPMVVKMFFEHEVLKETDVENWSNAVKKDIAAKLEKPVSHTVLSKFVEHMQPLLVWIKED